MVRANAAGVTPDYWDEACRHLAKRDRVMKKLIPQFGEARLQVRGDAFTTLARSVIGQQISVKAAQSVWDKVTALLPGVVVRARNFSQTDWADFIEICCPMTERAKVVKASPRSFRRASPNCGINFFMTRSRLLK